MSDEGSRDPKQESLDEGMQIPKDVRVDLREIRRHLGCLVVLVLILTVIIVLFFVDFVGSRL